MLKMYYTVYMKQQENNTESKWFLIECCFLWDFHWKDYHCLSPTLLTKLMGKTYKFTLNIFQNKDILKQLSSFHFLSQTFWKREAFLIYLLKIWLAVLADASSRKLECTRDEQFFESYTIHGMQTIYFPTFIKIDLKLLLNILSLYLLMHVASVNTRAYPCFCFFRTFLLFDCMQQGFAASLSPAAC